MRDFGGKWGVWAVMLAITVAQALYVFLIASEVVPAKLYHFRFFIPLGIVTAFVFYETGFSGIKQLLKPLLVWRAHIGWYVFALFWLGLFAIFVLTFKDLISGHGFQKIALSFSDFKEPDLVRTIVMVSVIEEIVWVGFCMTRLQKHFTPFLSSLFVAVPWFAWWVPVILYGEGVIPGLPIGILWVHYLGIAATCAWVYYYTGSALIVAIMQMITNCVSLVVPILPHLSSLQTYVIFVLGKCLFAILLFVFWGPKPLFRKKIIAPESDIVEPVLQA